MKTGYYHHDLAPATAHVGMSVGETRTTRQAFFQTAICMYTNTEPNLVLAVCVDVRWMQQHMGKAIDVLPTGTT